MLTGFRFKRVPSECKLLVGQHVEAILRSRTVGQESYFLNGSVGVDEKNGLATGSFVAVFDGIVGLPEKL